MFIRKFRSYSLLFTFITAHASEQVTITSSASKVPPLIQLTAQYIANNISRYKDGLIATDNSDVINLVLQRAQLYRLVRSTRLRLENPQSEIYKILITNEGNLYTDQRYADAIISPDSNCYIGLERRFNNTELHVNDLTGKSGPVQVKLDCVREITISKIAFVPHKPWFAFKAKWNLVQVAGYGHDEPTIISDLKHNDYIRENIFVSPDGLQIATVAIGDAGDIVYLWDITSTSAHPHPKKINLKDWHDLSFSPDGTMFACSAGNGLYLFDKSGKQIHNFGQRRWPWSKTDYSQKVFLRAFFSKDNRRLIASSTINNKDYFITIFDLETRKVVAELRDTYSGFGHGMQQWGDKIIAESADLNTIYSDTGVKLFDMEKTWRKGLHLIDNCTLLLEDRGGYTPTIKTDYGLCQQLPGFNWAIAIAPNGSKIAIPQGDLKINVYERDEENLNALEELIKKINAESSRM